MKNSTKLLIFIVTCIAVLAIALRVSMYVNPQPTLLVVNGDLPFTTNLDQIPDRLFPQAKDLDPHWYLFSREVFHFIGTCLCILISLFLLRAGLTTGPGFIFGILFTWIVFQEAYLHPLKYHQPAWNGWLDGFVWIVPFFVFLVLIHIPQKRGSVLL